MNHYTSAGAERVWKENITSVIYTPSPQPFPKQIAVAPGEVVSTGIIVPAQREVVLSTTGDVVAEIAGSSSTLILRTSDTIVSGRAEVRPEPWGHRYEFKPAGRTIGAPRDGELIIRGMQEHATVTVHREPEFTRRRWLARGEEFRPTAVPFAKGDIIERCVGAGLSYRMRFKGTTSAWKPLPAPSSCGIDYDHLEKADRVPTGGQIELRAENSATWFESIRAKRE